MQSNRPYMSSYNHKWQCVTQKSQISQWKILLDRILTWQAPPTLTLYLRFRRNNKQESMSTDLFRFITYRPLSESLEVKYAVRQWDCSSCGHALTSEEQLCWWEEQLDGLKLRLLHKGWRMHLSLCRWPQVQVGCCLLADAREAVAMVGVLRCVIFWREWGVDRYSNPKNRWLCWLSVRLLKKSNNL